VEPRIRKEATTAKRIAVHPNVKMKLLKLGAAPTFPLQIKRPPRVRDAWLNKGRAPFRLADDKGCETFYMTAPPTEVKKGKEVFLKLEAVPIKAVAEVWDGTGKMCRLWFRIGFSVWEAVAMNGWKPKPSSAPPNTGELSAEAVRRTLDLVAKIPPTDPHLNAGAV
jgi:hypothetical protein